MIFQDTWRMILDGTKTQTRRVVKPGEEAYRVFYEANDPKARLVNPTEAQIVRRDMYAFNDGWPLAVRTPRGIKWRVDAEDYDWPDLVDRINTMSYLERSDGSHGLHDSIPPTYAVQAARGGKALFRIKIKAIRQEPLRDITQEDAVAEGFQSVNVFVAVWSRLHDRKGERWADNPLVWVLDIIPALN